MAYLALFLLLVFAGAAPDIWPDTLGMSRFGPDIWVLVVTWIAIKGRAYTAVPWGIAIGLARDSLSLDPFGTQGFVLGVIAFAFCEGRRARGRMEVGSMACLAFVAVLCAEWLHLLRLLPMGGEAVTAAAFFDAFPVALWSALFALPFYKVIERTHMLDDLLGRGRAVST